ncbi:CAP domain-containing protein [uncultured Roseobacter sp.]|uniref:CAP domain-containing protein n=1 Tax=uncultured Roseobacter sp. TaxID=114847 RepID=UPI0026177336|nr:CAP domain-containing protein [uncultured Roseobacter sp.]
MIRLISIFLVLGLTLAACAPGPVVTGGADAPQLYRIGRGDTGKIQFRMLDSVNALRSASGQAPLELDPKLNAAAATHSRDMSIQNRPWHFGSDGSSPIDRVQRVGYPGVLIGENISETYESELETLAAWMEKPDTRRVILSPNATQMGFSWFQENNGKIWWTLVTGSTIPGAGPV